MIHCPECGNEIVKSYNEGKKLKLRTNIVIFEDGKALCKCQKCHAEVQVPVTIVLPTGRSFPRDKKVQYVVLEKMKSEVKKDAVEQELEKAEVSEVQKPKPRL